MKLRRIVGLAGVSGAEGPHARLISRIFDYVMTLPAIALFVQWHMDHFHLLSAHASLLFNWLIWLFFVFKFIFLFFLVKDHRRWWLNNWLVSIIILGGLPILFFPHFLPLLYNILRPLLAIVLFIPWIGWIKVSLMDGKLLTTVISLFFVVIIAGVFISGVDPSIGNPLDGIWWAWVTMSTVGFGDIVPTTLLGRLIAAVIILCGLLFFAVLTANFSSMFIRRSMFRMDEGEIHALRKLLAYEKTEREIDAKLLAKLEAIEQRLEALEKKHHS